ncbi:MAG: MATE family efflux transporter [Lachnospiraceae bacterium]|nr:MATE family efflux transporter [Lachnospiraceae bacterium]
MKFLDYDKEQVRKVVQIAWPAVLEAFFVAFVGLVDSFMVSSLGSAAVASVGLTTQPKFVGLAMFFAVNVSVSALVARRKGEQNREGANKIFITALAFIIAASIVISVLLVCFADPIIAFCGSEPDTHDGAVAYFRIIMGGMIFNCIQMGINSAQRGCGNTKITMRTNLVSNTVNVIFNFLLIQGHWGFPALGIHGAALATVLGTVVACIMSILSVCRKDTFVSLIYIAQEKLRPTIEAFKNLVKVGYSVFAEQLLLRVGFMATSLMAAAQGTDAMAAHQVGMNIMGLSFSFGDGLQSTAVALIGYSLGAKDPDLAKKYGSICRTIGGFISVILAVVYLFGGGLLYSLFFEEEQIIAIGVNIMRIIAVIVVLQISQVIYMGCLRGAGDTLYTAIVSTISVTIMRTAGSFFFCYVMGWGIVGIWMGVVADQLSRLVLASIRFKQGKWIQIKI